MDDFTLRPSKRALRQLRSSVMRGGVAALAVALVPFAARADDLAGAEEPIRLELRLPERCGTGAAFLERINEHARVRLANAQERDNARLFRVTIETADDSFVGTLVIEADGRASSPRVVRAETCEEAFGMLAFASALSVDPSARPTPTPTPPETRQAPRAPVAASPVAASPATAPPSAWRFGVGAGLGLDGYAAPGPVMSTRLFGEIHHRSKAAVQLGLSASAFGHAAAGNLSTQLTWYAVRFDVCPLALTADRVSLSPCATLRGGFVRGTGRGTADAHAETRGWIEPGVRARVGFALSERASIGASAGLGWTLLRPEFAFEPGVSLYLPPALCLGGELTTMIFF